MKVQKYELSLLEHVTREVDVIYCNMLLCCCVIECTTERCVSHAFWTRVWRRESQRRDVYTSLISTSKKFHHDFVKSYNQKSKKRERYSHQDMRMIMISNYY